METLPDRVVSLRPESPADHVKKLQAEIAEQLGLVRSHLRYQLSQARKACLEAQEMPLSAGEIEEARKLDMVLKGSLERLGMLAARK